MKPTQEPRRPTHVTRPGANHTGITLHPDLVAEMIEGTHEFGPTSRGGIEQLIAARDRAARDSEPAATMPPTRHLPAERLPVLDKLGARLAFERTSVRLYEALIGKLDTYDAFPGGPSRADLELLRDQERDHLLLAEELILDLGGDPTVVTPCANLQAAATRGICEVVVDPRTNVIECLEAIVIAELADHESWDQLGHAVGLIGAPAVEQRVRDAERIEDEHARKVRGWLAAAAAELAARPTH